MEGIQKVVVEMNEYMIGTLGSDVILSGFVARLHLCAVTLEITECLHASVSSSVKWGYRHYRVML